jgi:uncharacterized protein (TIGR02301 family)
MHEHEKECNARYIGHSLAHKVKCSAGARPLVPSSPDIRRLELDLTAKAAAIDEHMKALSHLFLSSFALVGLGSAMALAQPAPADAVAPPAPPAEMVPDNNAPPQGQPEAAPPENAPSSVEDAPVDTPVTGQSDWAPDINLDALRAARQETKVARIPGRAVRRKVLSDAGDGTLDTNNWTNADADAQLLSRGQRRARPVDPAKRADLIRLSRAMGALHALRVSCAGRDDQTYRSRMATLLDLEAPPSGDLRDPLVDAFNGGFQTYGRGAGACPADARAQEANLAKEGLVMARKLAAQYRPVPKVETKLPPATQPRQNVAIATPPQPKAAPQSPPNATPNRPMWQTGN